MGDRVKLCISHPKDWRRTSKVALHSHTFVHKLSMWKKKGNMVQKKKKMLVHIRQGLHLVSFYLSLNIVQKR